MLSKKNRITRKDFPAPQKQGFRLFSESFSGMAYPGKEQGVRISVVVSKKTAKLSVARNTIKRRFYAVIKAFLGEVSQGVLIVFYPKKGSEKVPFKNLSEEISLALKKAKIIS